MTRASWYRAASPACPDTPHYADQVERWRAHDRIPMYHDPVAARNAAEQTLHLVQDASRTAGEAE
ncbi:MAG: hypothetical protein U5Q44_04550 [Dehalococcoidia bacterium]|nr:hypothetical protein [Dehalococcoidia bacterium]